MSYDPVGQIDSTDLDEILSREIAAPNSAPHGFSPLADLRTDTMGIGDGFNSAVSELRSKSVEFNPDPARVAEQLYTAAGGEGQRVTFQLVEVSSIERLKTYLNLSAAASFGWGIFSGDASFDYIQGGSFTKYNNFISLRVQVTNPSELLRSRRLTQEALDYAREGTEVFLRMCGDEFVHGRSTGGELSAIVQFSSQSASDQQRVRAALSTTIGGFNGNGNLASAMDSLREISQTSIYLVRDGGVGKISDITQLKTTASEFPEVVRTRANPVIAKLLTAKYTAVSNFPVNLQGGGFDVAIERQTRFLGELAKWIDRAYEIRADLAYIKANPGQFEIDGPEAVNQHEDINEALISELFEKALACKTNPAGGCALPARPRFVEFSPRRRDVDGGVITDPKPKFGWVRNVGGMDLFEDFELHTEPTRDVQGGFLRFITGSHLPGVSPFRLRNPPPEPHRIWAVTYKCEAAAPGRSGCNECWAPGIHRDGANGVTDNQAWYRISEDGKSVDWKRDYGLRAPVKETYRLLYEVYRALVPV